MKNMTDSMDNIDLNDEKPNSNVISRTSFGTRKDGGFGWVIVGSTFLVFSLYGFHALTFGIFVPEFFTAFSLTESDVGLIASLRFGLFSFTGIFSGPLVQRFGCRPVAMVAVLTSAFCYVATAFAYDRFTLTITYGLIAGLGAGLATIPSVVIVQQYFTRRRAIAAGISSVGIAFFALVCSPLARVLVDIYGWRGACLLFGGFSLQLLVPTALYRPFIEEKPDIAPRTNATTCKQSWKRRMKMFATQYCNKEIFKLYFILFLVTSTTKDAIIDTYYKRLALIAQSIGIDPIRAAILPSISAVFTVAGRGLSGFIASCMPPQVPFGVCSLLSALLIFAVTQLPNDFLAHAFCVAIWGFSMGVFLGIQHTILATLVGVKLLPLALSWDCLFVGTFQIISNLIVGRLMDTYGSYRVTLLYAGTVHLCGSVGALTIIYLKWKEAKKASSGKDETSIQIST